MMGHLRHVGSTHRALVLLLTGLVAVLAPALPSPGGSGAGGALGSASQADQLVASSSGLEAQARVPVEPQRDHRRAIGRSQAADVAAVIDRLGTRAAGGVRIDDIREAAEVLDVDLGDEIDADAVERLSTAHASALPVFASVGKVEVHLPSYRTVLVGFHQASFGAARQMNSHNASLVNMTTLPSRGRPTGRRSAVDIAVVPDTPVVAPVSGRVVEVKRYALYGRYADVRVRIVPSSDTSMLVTVLHVTGPRISVGDAVTAGETVLADHATQFPFASQIDRYAGRLPHVHIEMRER